MRTASGKAWQKLGCSVAATAASFAEAGQRAGHWPIDRARFPGRKRTAPRREANTRIAIFISAIAKPAFCEDAGPIDTHWRIDSNTGEVRVWTENRWW